MKLAGGSRARCRATGHLWLLAWAPRSEGPLTALPHASFSTKGGRRASRGACCLSCGLWPRRLHPAVSQRVWVEVSGGC